MQNGLAGGLVNGQSLNDHTSSENIVDKKVGAVPSKRILKDHDLDQLLVYEKRGMKQRKDYFELFAERNKTIELAKK